ncbi:MAG: DUF933 domain-containing protein [bacterium]|jgi:ribosome-binding ATPase YchF (GTP1/OBG family)
MRIGLVGLALSGKSTLYELLTGIPVVTNGKPEARVGSALVPDRRVDYLSRLYNPRKTTYARIEFVDIPGLVPGEEKKANPFLEEIRKVDAIVYVLRAFQNPEVPHLEGDIDPLRDWELLEMELLLADLDLFEKRVRRIREARKKPKGWEKELALLEKCQINALEGEDKELFMEDLGLTETGIQRLARVAYDTLGLISFFTVGEDEVKAWTIRKDTPAPEAAGKIHSDIARGFIRAEILAYQDLLAAGSVARAGRRASTAWKVKNTRCRTGISPISASMFDPGDYEIKQGMLFLFFPYPPRVISCFEYHSRAVKRWSGLKSGQ